MRATIDATFITSIPNEIAQALFNLTSPDLTHVRTIKSEHKLPLMCYDIYEDPNLYIAVAEVNGLDNFRKLKEGAKIFFPPLDKSNA